MPCNCVTVFSPQHKQLLLRSSSSIPPPPLFLPSSSFISPGTVHCKSNSNNKTGGKGDRVVNAGRVTYTAVICFGRPVRKLVFVFSSQRRMLFCRDYAIALKRRLACNSCCGEILRLFTDLTESA